MTLCSLHSEGRVHRAWDSAVHSRLSGTGNILARLWRERERPCSSPRAQVHVGITREPSKHSCPGPASLIGLGVLVWQELSKPPGDSPCSQGLEPLGLESLGFFSSQDSCLACPPQTPGITKFTRFLFCPGSTFEVAGFSVVKLQ